MRPAPAAAAVRVRGGAGAALRRVALPRRTLGPHHAALDAAAAALPVVGRGRAPRAHGWRGRPARGEGWARAARRGRTVGAQVRAQLRARGAAGGGRLAEPEDSVSACAAALTRPRRCAACGGWRAARAPDVHDWVHVCVHMCVRSSACVCVPAYARMRRMRRSVRECVRVRVCVCARGGSGRLLIVCHYVYTRMYVCM